MLRRPIIGLLAATALVACGEDFSAANGTGGAAQGGSDQGGGGAAQGGAGQGGEGGPATPCAGKVEAAVVPLGWEGPLAIGEGSDEDSVPQCPAGTIDPLIHKNPSGEPAVCPCTCEQPSAAGCTASIGYWPSDPTCGGMAPITHGVTNCKSLMAMVATGHVEWVPSHALQSGTCAPTGGNPVLEPATWGTYARRCILEIDGEGCVPQPSSGLLQRICVAQTGDHTCPEGYPNKTTYFLAFDDGRACAGSCTCNGTSVTCAGTVSLYTTDSCSNAADTALPPNVCTAVPAGGLHSIGYVPMAQGTCTANPPTATGEVGAKEPVTVCCTETLPG